MMQTQIVEEQVVYRAPEPRLQVWWLWALLAAVAVGCLIAAAVWSRAQEPALPQTPATPLAVPPSLPEIDLVSMERGYVVAIDPGHGGVDGGAVGRGLLEADMTWDTAQELLALLQADDRFTPFLTKTKEMTMNPRARAALTNLGGADVILSIHGNSDPVYGASGFECYPAPPGRTYHAESLRLAELLAEGFGAEGARLRGEGGVRYLYYDENDDKQIVEVSDTTVHTDPSFGVLERSRCPAVLAEQCFVTNQADVAAFAGQEGCKRAAGVYYRALCAYFGVEPLDKT